MKRVRINAGKVGLVFKNGDYKRVISQGTYWLGINQVVLVYDLTKQFFASVAVELLLQDETLKAMLNVVEVKDNEIVLVYENGIFKKSHIFLSSFS